MERTKRISGWRQTVEDKEREDLHHLSHPQSLFFDVAHSSSCIRALISPFLLSLYASYPSSIFCYFHLSFSSFLLSLISLYSFFFSFFPWAKTAGRWRLLEGLIMGLCCLLIERRRSLCTFCYGDHLNLEAACCGSFLSLSRRQKGLRYMEEF